MGINNKKFKQKSNIILLFLLILFVFTIFRIISSVGDYKKVSTSELLQNLSNGSVKSVTLVTGNNHLIKAVLNNGDKIQSDYIDGAGSDLQNMLEKLHVDKKITKFDVNYSKPDILYTIFINIAPLLIVFFLFIMLTNSLQSGGSRIMSFAKMRNRGMVKKNIKTRFSDVAGANSAIQELQEIKEFLRNPSKFYKLGAKIPRGVLLYGPPGTGKTLLARAVAGEANVKFYSISGSDFVEMFVGVGASRVRSLFEQAKNDAPVIIFIDEIDAVGRHRGAGFSGGHDEREQTLNQLLVEMDGFDQRSNVIVIAATNRADILDPALLRPGRFDRRIGIDAPDYEARCKILDLHAKSKVFADDVDLKLIARVTQGFTGADLANILNEAAILTARFDESQITKEHLNEAVDRIMAGPKRGQILSEEEKMITAYHEGGHALVAHALPGTDPVEKITILPRGRALGYTLILPEKDKYSIRRTYMLNQLAYLLGGRAAEELIFKDPSSGASNDIEKATHLARNMVAKFGMAKSLGAVQYDDNSDGNMMRERQRQYSEESAARIDNEILNLMREAYNEAHTILQENMEILHSLAKTLLSKETLYQNDIKEIFAQVKFFPVRNQWSLVDGKKE